MVASGVCALIFLPPVLGIEVHVSQHSGNVPGDVAGGAADDVIGVDTGRISRGIHTRRDAPHIRPILGPDNQQAVVVVAFYVIGGGGQWRNLGADPAIHPVEEAEILRWDKALVEEIPNVLSLRIRPVCALGHGPQGGRFGTIVHTLDIL